jgi:hypothetical protein
MQGIGGGMEDPMNKLEVALVAAEDAFIKRIYPHLGYTKAWNLADCWHFTLDGVGIAFTTLYPDHTEEITAGVKQRKDGLERIVEMQEAKKRTKEIVK